MEEAAYMDQAVLYEVIVPLLEVDKTALICISTLVDSYNFFSDFCNLKTEDGKHVFIVVNISMICENCKRLPVENQVKCTHMEKNRPAWKERGKLDMIMQTFYKDNISLLKRESMGDIGEGNNRAFPLASIKKFQERPLFLIKEMSEYPKFLFTLLDPNGFGGSHVSIITVYLFRNHLVIAGLDSYEIKTLGAGEQFLNAHINALRADIRFSNSHIIFIPESNMAIEAQRYNHVVKNRVNFHPLYMSKNPNTPGVYTSSETKQKYVESLHTHLLFEAISFDEAWISANPIYQTEESKLRYRSTMLLEFFREMSDFKKIKRFNNNGVPSAPILSGKVDEQGKEVSGKNDDKVIVAAMACYWPQQIIKGQTTMNIYDFK